MTTIAERKEEVREVTIYRISKDFGNKSNTYRITKVVACVELDYYHVTIEMNAGRIRDHTLWCSCQGFRRQKFDLHKHKHVVLAVDYLTVQGAPEWAEYTILGTGSSARIKHLRNSTDGTESRQ